LVGKGIKILESAGITLISGFRKKEEKPRFKTSFFINRKKTLRDFKVELNYDGLWPDQTFSSNGSVIQQAIGS
jgi:hypothetical protein